MGIALRRLWHSRSAGCVLGLLFFLGPIRSAGAEEIGQLSFTQLRPLGSGGLTVGPVNGVDTIADAR